jgi:hypothetical protein
MKQVTLLILVFAFQISWAQKSERYPFSYTATKLDKVLSDIEQRFNVRYSYADSIVAPKTITLSPKKYTLEQLHSAIEQQTNLAIARIDVRYYSIYKLPELREEQLKEILVEGFLTKGINKVDQKVIISPQKVEALPGVTDADILLSLQQLPGVKSPNETASGLHIRGGTADQNLILWDGIRMYHPGHLFGMISGFNPNVEQTVDYYNKAANPKFGERISSIIDIKPTNNIADHFKADAGVNALNADLYVRAPIIKDKLGLQLSGRKSFTEWWQSPTFNSLAEKVFQNTNFRDFDERNHFEFADYSAKLNYKLNEGTDFSLTTILIDNHLNFNTDSGISGSKNQMMDILNRGYSFHWNQKYGPKLAQKILIYYSAYRFNYEKKQQYGPDTFDIFIKQNRITDSGVELNFDYTLTDHINIEFGYQYLGNDISHSFTEKAQGLEIVLDQKQLYNNTHVGYANFKYILGTWNFQGGARYNRFNTIKSNSLEPRVFVQKNLTQHLIWQGSYEKKSQLVSQVREGVTNDLSLENYVWTLSEQTDYPIQKAQQFTTGLIYKTKSWLIDVDAYYKTIEGITSLNFGFLNQFDTQIHQGGGFTKGVDVLVRKTAPTWRAWMTYTFQDSQNKFDGMNANDYFPINSDSKHAFNLSFNKKWKNYAIAVGWFWHSGKPYSLLNASNEVASFNTERLPAYHRLDVSGSYQFRNEKSWSGKVGFSVYNAYNRHTLISKEYERQFTSLTDFENSKFTLQNYYSLGITPNIFLRISL